MDNEDVSKLEILGVTSPEPRRGRAVAIGLSLALGLVIAGGAAWSVLAERPEEAAVPSAVLGASPSPSRDGAPAELGIKGLRTYSGLASDHVVGSVDYAQSPPVGGPHDQVWLACGEYDVPVRNENVVHDLEHGAVWITYRPGISDADLKELSDLLPDNGILSPYPDLHSPVVLTVWGLQLGVDEVDDPRIAQFLQRFGDGEAAPEPGVSCAGGTTDPQGGFVPPATSV